MSMLTIALCTYNRADILAKCLDSLCTQNVSNTLFSVLIIDNNSTDNTQEVAASFADRFSSFKIVFEAIQGLSHARNRAIKECSGDWLAFLDDDAKAPSNWVETILATIANNDFDAFGGGYTAWHCFGPKPAWFDSTWESYIGPSEYGLLQPPAYIAGGNCAMRKNWVVRCGGFPTTIGMAGQKCAYGEETALFNAMQAQGAKLGFVPAMYIEHCVMPYKYKLRWRLGSFYARGRDSLQANNAHPASLFFCIVSFIKSLLSGIRNGLNYSKKRPWYWRRFVFECLRAPAFSLGRTVGTQTMRKKR